MNRPWEIPNRPGWVLGDTVRLQNGLFKVAVFHHASNTGSRVYARSEELLRARARIEVDLILDERARKLEPVLSQDEAEGGLVRMIN